MKSELVAAKTWLDNNRSLLRKYRGQWIAYNGKDGLLGHDTDVQALVKNIQADGNAYVLKFVDPYFYSGLRRLVPVRFRPFRQDTWEPTISIPVSNRDAALTVEMLVDSGADLSTISLKLGELLGFIRHDDEVSEVAAGVNGTVEYLIRKVVMEIEGHRISVPIAWFQVEGCDDLLLGREVVFDVFDIEFRQKDRIVEFKKRVDS